MHRMGWKDKTGHNGSARTTVWEYFCPANSNRELKVTYLSLLASVMFWSFQETDTSNPIVDLCNESKISDKAALEDKQT